MVPPYGTVRSSSRISSPDTSRIHGTNLAIRDVSTVSRVRDGCYTILYRFYNYIWLVLNDVIIGWAAGAVICEHSQLIASFLDERIRVDLSSLRPRYDTN